MKVCPTITLARVNIIVRRRSYECDSRDSEGP